MVDTVLMQLAFSAGVVTFFSPCSYALLPAYISYYLGRVSGEERNISSLRGALKGVGVGTAATLGFLSVFI